MGKQSNIQWTDATWNVAVGCTKVDEDCKYCYMYRDSFDGKRYDPKTVRKTKTVFDLPLKLKEPSLIFTLSLTDFFHPAIDSFRKRVCKDLCDKLEQIRREEYNAGWKDAKSKKVAKRTWFKSWW